MSRRDNFIQHARGTPFDNSTSRGYSSTDVQASLEELRDHTVYVSETTAISASGTRTLTATNVNLQYLTGTASGYSVVLPSALTIPVSSLYQIINTTPNTVAIKDGAGVSLFILSQNSIGYLYLQAAGSVGGTWVYYQILASSTASGIINYNIISSTPFSTTSATFVALTGMTITPEAGTYAVWYSSSILVSTNNALAATSIYNNGTLVADSIRTVTASGSSFTTNLSTQTITTVNGSQAIDMRVRQSTGTLTVNDRSMLLIRLGS